MYRTLDRITETVAVALAMAGGLVLLAIVVLTCVSIIGRALVPFDLGIGPIRGIFGDVSRPIGGRAEVRLWASAWHFQDALRAGLSGVSWHAGLGASTALTELATLQLRAEHSYNRYVGNRYRLTAALTLRVHR